MKLLLFGGTVEGRVLAQRLAAAGVPVTCSVATEYGKELLEPQENLTVIKGRLEEGEMAALLEREDFTHVVDATHPYAPAVSENIRQAASEKGVPLFRLLRPSQAAEGVTWVDTPQEAAAFLARRGERALLTTGSKELSAFTAVPHYQTKLWVRVLPSMESLKTALELGFPAKQIICMQGPFSQKLNTAMLEQIGAQWLVTKDSGKAGGFLEKVSAAKEAGAQVLVIRRPTRESGFSLEALYQRLIQEAKG